MWLPLSPESPTLPARLPTGRRWTGWGLVEVEFGHPNALGNATRAVSSQGGLMVAGVKIHLGHVHRGKVVTVAIEDSQFHILHEGIQLATCPRTVIKEVTRRSASGHPRYQT